DVPEPAQQEHHHEPGDELQLRELRLGPVHALEVGREGDAATAVQQRTYQDAPRTALTVVDRESVSFAPMDRGEVQPRQPGHPLRTERVRGRAEDLTGGVGPLPVELARQAEAAPLRGSAVRFAPVPRPGPAVQVTQLVVHLPEL